jgi:hypothetical protein
MTAGETVIELLAERGGFDWWWDEIDPEIQAEIVAELNGVVVLKAVTE